MTALRFKKSGAVFLLRPPTTVNFNNCDGCLLSHPYSRRRRCCCCWLAYLLTTLLGEGLALALGGL